MVKKYLRQRIQFCKMLGGWLVSRCPAQPRVWSVSPGTPDRGKSFSPEEAGMMGILHQWKFCPMEKGWSSNTFVIWCEELTHWKRPWCRERLREKGEGGNRGWDGWMASPTQWTWVWPSSGRWWRTGKPHALQSVGSQRVRHNLATEQQWKREDLLEMAPKRQTQTQNDKQADLSSKEGRISISVSCPKMQNTKQWTLCHGPPRTQRWMEEDFLDQEAG